jgi:hypothetical protein
LSKRGRPLMLSKIKNWLEGLKPYQVAISFAPFVWSLGYNVNRVSGIAWASVGPFEVAVYWPGSFDPYAEPSPF